MVRFRNVVVSLWYFCLLLTLCAAGSYYLSVERPVIQYLNRDYVPFFNITSRRFGRRNPKYYVDIHLTVTHTLDDSATFDFYFYEFVHTHYRPTFLEMHLKWCNMFLKDSFVGAALRAALPGKCPHPPGTYHLFNLTLNDDAIPPHFPFTKGRLIVNSTQHHLHTASCYADIELKKFPQKG